MPDERNKRISEHAYRLWEREGQPADRALDHWVEAERQVGAGDASGPNQGEGHGPPARTSSRKTKAGAASGKVERQPRKAKADLESSKGGVLPGAGPAGRRHGPERPQKSKSSTRG